MRRILARWPLAAVLTLISFPGGVALGAESEAAPEAATATATDDPFQWLEDVQGEKALAWVKEQNAVSTKLLESRPEYDPIFKRTLEILDSKEKIPTPELLGDMV